MADSSTFFVKAHPALEDRVALFDRDPDYPVQEGQEPGEIYIAGQEQPPVEVVSTDAVLGALQTPQGGGTARLVRLEGAALAKAREIADTADDRRRAARSAVLATREMAAANSEKGAGEAEKRAARAEEKAAQLQARLDELGEQFTTLAQKVEAQERARAAQAEADAAEEQAKDAEKASEERAKADAAEKAAQEQPDGDERPQGGGRSRARAQRDGE